jgi:dolichol-phosphate mannosyltransferase
MYKVSIIVLAFNENQSLRKTIQDLAALTDLTSTRILISTSANASIECLEAAKALESEFLNVNVYFQNKPFVAAAVLEALELCNSEYVVYMSADGETPATLVPSLLREMDRGCFDIVLASRWIQGGSFSNYGRLKWLLSKFAQNLCKFLYASDLSEFTYGFRIYRTPFLKTIKFHEEKHPFFLESLLIPIRLGARIKEIPAAWHPRTEGRSVMDLTTLVAYLRPIFRVRFVSKSKLIK